MEDVPIEILDRTSLQGPHRGRGWRGGGGGGL